MTVTGERVFGEIRRIIDASVGDFHLRELLEAFVAHKESENPRWGAITEAVHGLLGGTSPEIGRMAAATETILLALDIIDDLQDQDNMTVPWMNVPAAYAMNAVLALLAIAQGQLAELGQGVFAAEASRRLLRSIDGQQADLNGTVLTEQDYVAMVGRKSGSLLQLACLAGYSLVNTGEDDAEISERLKEMAECVGVASQIGNDLNDVIRYDVKNDLLHRKRTLPILFLLVDSEEEFPPLSDYYDGRITTEQFLRHKTACLQYIQDSGCLEYCRVIQSLYLERAEELFALLPGEESWRERVRDLLF